MSMILKNVKMPSNSSPNAYGLGYLYIPAMKPLRRHSRVSTARLYVVMALNSETVVEKIMLHGILHDERGKKGLV